MLVWDISSNVTRKREMPLIQQKIGILRKEQVSKNKRQSIPANTRPGSTPAEWKAVRWISISGDQCTYVTYPT